MNSACSRLMYIIVFLIFRCPSMFCTCMISWVSWYSIVAFQCLSVWNVMFSILGFCSFCAASFLCCVNTFLRLSMSGWNIVCLFFGIWFIMSMSLLGIGSIRGLLPLVGVMLSVFCSVEKSIHLSSTASEMRMAVSFSVWSSVAVRFPHEAISWSISNSVGMNGSLSWIVYFGFFHLISKYARSEL